MKNIFTESLESRLIKYSVITGALLLSANDSNAQVIVTNTNVTVNSSNRNYSIDFNGDGIKDVRITWFTGSGGSGIDVYDGSGGVDNFFGKFVSPNYFYPYALTQSKSIPATSPNWGRAAAGWGGTLNWNSSFGYWKNISGQDRYLGVKFQISGLTHYGWVKMATPDKSSITILQYAYQQKPDTGINPPLPVELTTFTADNIEGKVELEWKTATEINNYGFDVERQVVGSQKTVAGTWEKIGFVKGSGNSSSPKNYSFIDDNPVSGDVEYRLKQIDNDGSFKYSQIVTVNSLPTKFELLQNYPNPFNPTTTIQYAIPKAEHVTLKVYDELGKEVKTLVDENKAAGQYNVQFNGRGLASGIYYYRIAAGNFNEVKKLMLLK